MEPDYTHDGQGLPSGLRVVEPDYIPTDQGLPSGLRVVEPLELNWPRRGARSVCYKINKLLIE